MQKKDDLYVITVTKNLANYIITVTEKSPVRVRFTLTTRLQNYVLDALECLYIANLLPLGEERRDYQQKALSKLELTDYFSALSFEQKTILEKQYAYISKLEAEAVLYLKKWMASDKKRLSTS